ncbi:hypothetical protein M404DRAFT_1001123 [Pisolithus tinctorius Marx 270]|uniref:Uncharacterized protein n=1 Tax=Pisolithus tinctorius Marx 270 TaxID=870435 RepID=A0A0C3K271_PISTI|nr:hypothetical protein M404DRAFT_1001123 [Pisolithus tinctorius Marx 270]
MTRPPSASSLGPLSKEPPGYTDKRAHHLLDQLQAIEDAPTCHLWHMDTVDDHSRW